MKPFLKIGALAGGIAGLALALFLEIVGERTIERAVAFEAASAPPAQHHHEMFSRVTQQVGGGIGAVLYGVCMGLIFAVVFAAVRHLLKSRTDFRRAVTVSAAGFVTVFLIPFAKYPANPPAVGDPATITRRTVLYLIILGWSIVATWSAWRVARWLRDGRRLPEDRWVPLAAIAYTALVGAGLTLLPGPPDKVTAPATLVWRFRIASAGGAAVFWATLGLAAGFLLARARNTSLTRDKEETASLTAN